METISDKIETGQPFGLYDILDELQTSVTALEDADTAREVLDGVCGATIVVGATHTDTIAATIQLTDYEGDDMAVAGCVKAFLASDAGGLNVNVTALTTEMSIGSDGSIAVLLASKNYLLISEADGDIDITMGYTTGAKDFYLVVVLPNGKRVVSTKFAFTAE